MRIGIKRSRVHWANNDNKSEASCSGFPLSCAGEVSKILKRNWRVAGMNEQQDGCANDDDWPSLPLPFSPVPSNNIAKSMLAIRRFSSWKNLME
jgi:hypothetical protein